MTTLPLATVKNTLSAVVDQVESAHERVVITRKGVPAAVLISPADLAALEETLDVLPTPTRWSACGSRGTTPLGGCAECGAAEDAAEASGPLTTSGPPPLYKLEITASAARALSDRLPEAVAVAVLNS